jgi:hypothetical protein
VPSGRVNRSPKARSAKMRRFTSTAAEIARPNTLVPSTTARSRQIRCVETPGGHSSTQVDSLQQVSLGIWHETDTGDDKLSAGTGTGAHVTDVQRDLTSGGVLADFVVLG